MDKTNGTMKAAICDDSPEILVQLESYMDRFAERINKVVEVRTFKDSGTFCSALKRNEWFDLILLDIELKSAMNGFDICRQVRNSGYINPTIPVIFISGEEGYEKELVHFYPLFFIPKPIEYARFYNIVRTALNLETIVAVFEYKANHEYKRIPIKNIIFFESRGRKICVHTTEGDDLFYRNLDDVQTRLKNTRKLKKHSPLK